MDLAPAFEGLSDRERIYVEGVLRGLPKKASAQAAGYQDVEFARLEKRPHVLKALDAGRNISIKETGITREKVTDMLMEAWRNATSTTEQVMVARELGKLHGLYEAKKVEVKHQLEHVSRTEQLRTLTVEELERIALEGKPLVIDGEFDVMDLPRLDYDDDERPD